LKSLLICPLTFVFSPEGRGLSEGGTFLDVTKIYFVNSAVKIAKKVKPSGRGVRRFKSNGYSEYLLNVLKQ